MIWIYKEISAVKHSAKQIVSDYTSCGLYTRSSPGCWKSDEKGLSNRRECKKCVNALSEYPIYVGLNQPSPS